MLLRQVMLVTEFDGPATMAQIGMMQALDRNSAKLTPAPPTKTPPRLIGSFGDHNRAVNSRDKRPEPRIATLHCAIVKAFASKPVMRETPSDWSRTITDAD
jgi:hypothetical protein